VVILVPYATMELIHEDENTRTSNCKHHASSRFVTFRKGKCHAAVDEIKDHGIVDVRIVEPMGMLLSHRNVAKKCLLSHRNAEFLHPQESQQEIRI